METLQKRDEQLRERDEELAALRAEAETLQAAAAKHGDTLEKQKTASKKLAEVNNDSKNNETCSSVCAWIFHRALLKG